MVFVEKEHVLLRSEVLFATMTPPIPRGHSCIYWFMTLKMCNKPVCFLAVVPMKLYQSSANPLLANFSKHSATGNICGVERKGEEDPGIWGKH